MSNPATQHTVQATTESEIFAALSWWLQGAPDYRGYTLEQLGLVDLGQGMVMQFSDIDGGTRWFALRNGSPATWVRQGADGNFWPESEPDDVPGVRTVLADGYRWPLRVAGELVRLPAGRP